jgi:hypothetical protein
MSVDLRSDEPYAWLGSVQQLGLLAAAPEPLPKDRPALPGALLRLCGARAAGVPVQKPAAPNPERCAALGGTTEWGRVKA